MLISRVLFFLESNDHTLWCSDYGTDICTTDGWLVWLRRLDNSVSFNKTWKEYERGFGELDGNFWLGLELLHNLTKTGNWSLRAEITSWAKQQKWAEYNNFKVSARADNYTLKLAGMNSGTTALGTLMKNNGQKFSTTDRDNDIMSGRSCSNDKGGGGGWWYSSCSYLYPTAYMGKDGDSSFGFVFWFDAVSKFGAQALKSLYMSLKPMI